MTPSASISTLFLIIGLPAILAAPAHWFYGKESMGRSMGVLTILCAITSRMVAALVATPCNDRAASKCVLTPIARPGCLFAPNVEPRWFSAMVREVCFGAARIFVGQRQFLVHIQRTRLFSLNDIPEQSKNLSF